MMKKVERTAFMSDKSYRIIKVRAFMIVINIIDMSANLPSSTFLALMANKLQTTNHNTDNKSYAASQQQNQIEQTPVSQDPIISQKCNTSSVIPEDSCKNQPTSKLWSPHLNEQKNKIGQVSESKEYQNKEQKYKLSEQNLENSHAIPNNHRQQQNYDPNLIHQQNNVNLSQTISTTLPQLGLAPSHFSGDFVVQTSKTYIKSTLQISPQNYIPPLAIINNLLTLSHIFNNWHLKVQIKRLSKKFKIPYCRLLIIFCIEKIIELFYMDHDINIEVSELYIFQKIDSYLFKLFQCIRMNNWFVLRRVLRGVLNRFGCLKYYHDPWLNNLLTKKKNLFESTGINVRYIKQSRQLFAQADGKINLQLFLSKEEPLDVQLKFIDYNKKYPELKLEDENLPQLLHDPEATKVENKLAYFQKKKLLCKSTAKSSISSFELDSSEFDKNMIQFSISIVRVNPPKSGEQILQRLNYVHKWNENCKIQKKSMKVVIESSRLEDQYKEKKERISEKKEAKEKEIEEQQKLRAMKPFSSKTTARKSVPIPQPTTHQEQLIAPLLIRSQPKNEYSSSNKPALSQSLRQVKKLDFNIQDIMKDMEEEVYAYFVDNPDFGLDDLLSKISGILNRKKVPKKLHKQIGDKWLKKFMN